MATHIITCEPTKYNGFREWLNIKSDSDRRVQIWGITSTEENPSFSPFGSQAGGLGGRVIRVDVLMKVYDTIKKGVDPNCIRPILFTPQGEKLTSCMLKSVAHYPDMILVCGCMEGIDQRFIDITNPLEISIGDFYINSGDTAAMLFLDAISRFWPKQREKRQGSYGFDVDFLLDPPNYTEPEKFIYEGESFDIPKELLTGIKRDASYWRMKESLKNTMKKRPDLFTKRTLTEIEKILVEEIINEEEENGSF